MVTWLSRKKLGFIVANLLMIGLLSFTAIAYVKNPGDWTHEPYPISEFMRICDNMPGEGALRTREAAIAWNYRNLKFSFGTNACLSNGTFPKKNDINQVDYGGSLPAHVPARTSVLYYKSNGNIIECDVRFNDSRNWNVGVVYPATNEIDWSTVAKHEWGHCLGLGHASGKASVMFESILAGQKKSLTTDDLDGRNAIYGKVAK